MVKNRRVPYMGQCAFVHKIYVHNMNSFFFHMLASWIQKVLHTSILVFQKDHIHIMVQRPNFIKIYSKYMNGVDLLVPC